MPLPKRTHRASCAGPGPGSMLLPAAHAGTLPAQPGPQPARPNIVWITVEDITTFLGAYGDREAMTPNIDRLAGEGVLYTHAYRAAGCARPRAPP